MKGCEEISRNLKAARIAAGLTQEKLAIKAGIEQSQISRIERGKVVDPAGSTLADLAEALDCSVDVLLGRAAPANGAGGGPVSIAIAAIHTSPLNPRKTFDETALDELGQSILAQGVLEPVLVRPDPPGNGPGETYELILGERRWRAARLAGLDAIPALVKHDWSDADVLEAALVENLQREDVPPLEEADAFAMLIAMDPEKWRPATIAPKIGKTKRYVQQRLALREKLSPKALKALAAGDINFAQARQLTTAAHKLQDKVLGEIKSGRVVRGEDVGKRIRGDAVPVTRAIFKREKYTGPIVTDPETGHEFFADRDAFMALQDAAVKKRVKELATEWKWARQESWFYPGNFDHTYDKKMAGAIVLLEHDGKVTEKLGLVTRGGDAGARRETKAEKDARLARQKDFAAREKASEDYNATLVAALAKDPVLAARIVVYMAVIDDDPYDTAALLGLELPDPWSGPRLAAAAWDKLASLDDAAMKKLVVSIASAWAPAPTHRPLDPVECDIARRLGVEIPEALRPPAAPDDDEAAAAE